jgi:hypothetical protein
MLEHAVWSLPSDQLKVWLTILSKANYKDGDWDDGVNRVHVPCGSLVTSQDHLAVDSRVGRQTVRTAIRNLIRLESISTNIVTNRYTIIHVLKWPIYNGTEVDANQLSNQQPTNPQPTANHALRREEGKKDKKETYTSTFLSFWEAYPRKESKQDAWKAWNQIEPQNGLVETILASIKQHSPRWTDPQYIPLPASYLRGKRWEDVLITPTVIQSPRDPKTIWKSQEEYLAHKKRAGIDPRYRVPEWETV